MKHLLLLPARTGGSKFGWSFLSTFAECETKFWNTHLRPMLVPSTSQDEATSTPQDEGGESASFPTAPTAQATYTLGIEPRTYAQALDIGTRVHAGIEAWLRSGWDAAAGVDTGYRSLDAAINAHDHSPAEGFATDEVVESIAVADRLLRLYHSTYGPDGTSPDWPRKQVFAVQGKPAIEHELALDVGYGGYIFTARLDYIYMLDDYLFADEHKTASARTVQGTLARSSLDGQFTGQNLLLATHFPEHHLGGVTCDVLVKDRGKSDKPALLRKDTSRTPQQLEKFRMDMARRLDRIENTVGNYTRLLTAGMRADDAARLSFDASPPGYRCVDAFGMRCAFYDLCANRDEAEHLAALTMKPRSVIVRGDEEDARNPFVPTVHEQ